MRLQTVADHARPTAIMPGSIRSTTLLAAAQALLLAGCAVSGPPAGPTPASASPASCVLVPAESPGTSGAGTRHAPGDIEVALERPVDPASAPGAMGGSARLVFRQLYETLVRIDCQGHVRPGLAASWWHDAEGTQWSFTLRPDARFWDGTPVTAQAVARSWASGGATTGDGGEGAGPLIASESVAGERELTVFLTRPSTAAATFAQPALAVTGADTYGPWPVGSGPYRPVAAPDLPPGDIRVVAGGGAPGADSITFSILGSAGARGALDRGVDVLVAADPEVVAYARELPGFTTVPLPWSRTYVVAAVDTGKAAGGPEPAVPAEDLQRLSRAAVQADARPVQPPFWWRGGGCSATASPLLEGAPRQSSVSSTPLRGPRARIVFPAGDAVARSLAERFVGLAGLGSAMPPWLGEAVPGLRAARGSVVAAGLDPDALVRALRDGGALAFVVPMPRAPAGPCVAALLGRGNEVVRAVLSPTSALRVTPLLDVRSSVVIRSGTAEVGVDGDGTLIFRPPEDVP